MAFRMKIIIGALLSLAIALGADAEGFKDVVGPFVAKHRVECHDAQTQKGSFNIELLTGDVASAESVKRWERVLTRIEAGEMPPPKKTRPDEGDVARVLTWAKTELAAAAKVNRADGRTRIRRLNRREYENTVHDLLGIHTPLQDLLPVDDTADGFDTAGSALSISPVHVQRYMEAAELALSAAVMRGPKPETVTRRFSYDHEAEKYFMTHGNNKPMIRPRNGGEVWFFAEPHIEVPGQLRQFADLTKSAPGRYRVRVSTYAHDTRGGRLPFLIRTTQSKQLLGYFDALPEKPAVTEVDFWFDAGDTIIVGPYKINLTRTERGLSIYPPKVFAEPEGPALAVQWVEVEGPINETWPPTGQKRLFADVPLKKLKEMPKEVVLTGRLDQLRYSDQLSPVPANAEAEAKRLLEGFLPRAFRRPVTAEDVGPYLGVVKRSLERKESFEAAMMGAYKAALCSPDFLFLVEEPGALSDHALACRLSYFLWRSSPDDALRTAADRGELRRPEILRREAERMLASPRAKAFVTDFLDQWLHLRDIDATMPDKQLFPEYFEVIFSAKIDGLLRESLLDETRMLFTELLRGDGSLVDLIDANYTFLNNRLADYYGLPAVEGVAMRKVNLPPDCARGGLLTQASILKVTANGSSTSPVLRGAWVLENILGRPVPPPPPNVGAIEPDTRGASTIRERLTKHQNSATCAACHKQIDPPGFALEGFDPVGQARTFYRTSELGAAVKAKFEGSPVKYKQGATVDASGQMADGAAFDGIKAFKQLLTKQPGAVARCLAGKLVTFGTGRRTEAGDLLALDGVVARAKAKNYGLRTLVLEVIGSELFVNK